MTNFDGINEAELAELQRLLHTIEAVGTIPERLTVGELYLQVHQERVQRGMLVHNHKFIIYRKADTVGFYGEDAEGNSGATVGLTALAECGQCGAQIRGGWMRYSKPELLVCSSHITLVTRSKKSLLRGK